MALNGNEKLYGIGISHNVGNRLTIYIGYKVLVLAPKLCRVYFYKTKEEHKPEVVKFFGLIINVKEDEQ